jgi:TPR repeat protein
VGTGFVIYSKGPFTILVTAKHVLGSNEKDDQTRNPDWQVQNGTISRQIKILAPDDRGTLIEKAADVKTIEISQPGTDLVLFSINGSGYKPLRLAKTRDNIDDSRKVMLLGYRAGDYVLTRPAPNGSGQSIDLQKYHTMAESNFGESGAPWIDVNSGEVVAVASASGYSNDGPSNDATIISTIYSTLTMFNLDEHEAERDDTAYQNAKGNLQLLKDYVQSCVTGCAYRDAAATEITSLQQAASKTQTNAQALQEDAQYTAARGDLKKLQTYVRSCTVCASKAAANSEITSIARQICDRTFAASFDQDVAKSVPPMRDTASLTDDDVQAGLDACLIMRGASDERHYLTEAGRGYATVAGRRAAADDLDNARANIAKAVDLWQAAAKLGSGAAMNFLGAYYNGTYNSTKVSFVQPDSQKAVNFWLQGATANNVKAMENIGVVYLAGPADYPPIPRDTDKAQLWLTKAIQGGSTYAAAVLGKALFYGLPSGSTADPQKGLAYLATACAAGEPAARRFYEHAWFGPEQAQLPATRPRGCDSSNAPVTTSGVASVLPSSAKTAPTYWDFNGSILQLIADGPSRKFYYYAPRPGLDAVGVKRGTLAFDGKRQENKYTGSAYVFSKACGALAYQVNGIVSDDQRSIRFSGMVPGRTGGCNDVTTTAETFEIDWRANGIN